MLQCMFSCPSKTADSTILTCLQFHISSCWTFFKTRKWEIHFNSLDFKMEVTSFQVLSITALLSTIDTYF